MADENGKSAAASQGGANDKAFFYPFLFRILHWLLTGSLLVLVLTGFSMYAVSRPQWSIFSGVLPEYFWPGRVYLFHIWASLIYFPALVTVFWIWCRTKAPMQLTQLILLGGGMLVIASGLALLEPMGPPIVYTSAFWIHTIVGAVVIPIGFLWHAAVGLTRKWKRLPAAFHPFTRWQLKPLLWFVPLTFLTTCLILNGFPATPEYRVLTAKRISPPRADHVDMTLLPFAEASPLVIEVANGVGFDAGRTAVTLRALHDGNQLFVQGQWNDPSEDRRYMPWEKTPGGWKHLVVDKDDESLYYEDKFSLVYPIEADWQFDRFGCAVHCHVGGGRKYGYKGADRLVDVWHWKSTRTDPTDQVDDKYWAEADFASKDVGRHGDPKQSGGYATNVSEDRTRPAFLPDGPDAVDRGIIHRGRAVEYAPEAAAKIAAGTIVPGIVASPAVGDRGDVSCFARYRDGQWRLYIRRKLDTGSDYDAKFEPGRRYPFGCAAFDHSSKRHAYAMPVYQMELEE